MGDLPNSQPSAEQPQARREQTSFEIGATSPALEAAIETECVALLALEASRARVRFLPGDYARVEADICGAIDLLRGAITELRARVGGSPPSLLSLGFVARAED